MRMRDIINLIDLPIREAVAATSILYHGTSQAVAKMILGTGTFHTPSWWGTIDIAKYYAEEAAEEDDSGAAIFSVDLARFKIALLEPDGNTIAEPIILGRKTEEMLYATWQKSRGTWKDSLRIYGSVIYRGQIAVTDADCRMIALRPKSQPEQRVADHYRRILRLIKCGRATPDDIKTKEYIARKFDIRGLEDDIY